MLHKINIKDQISLKGEVIVRTWKDGRIIQETRGKNIITDKGKNVTLALLGKVSGFTGIEYCAIGTGTTTPASTDLVLDNEVGRRAITLVTKISDTEYQWETFFEADYPTGTFTIWEVGLFGNGATSTKDSGDLITRLKLSTSITKDNTLTLTVDYRIYF